MEQEFSFKELYSIKLKAAYDMKIGNKEFKEGEVVTEFESAQLANLSELRSYITAHGGFDDRPRVIWDSTKEINFQFTRGIFDKVQFAMMQNMKFIEEANEEIILTESEKLESDENGIVTLKYAPCAHLKIYDSNGESLEYILTNNQANIHAPYTNVIVTYDFKYNGSCQEFIIGQRFLNGFLSLEARTKVKDDITGQVHTGIIKIPKLKLVDGLSIRVGNQANPQIGNFKAVGYPTGSHGNQKVMEFLVLSDDIDSDIN